jgi:hypothetical protein
MIPAAGLNSAVTVDLHVHMYITAAGIMVDWRLSKLDKG